VHDAEVLARLEACSTGLLAVGGFECGVELGAGLLEPGERFVQVAADLRLLGGRKRGELATDIAAMSAG